ncbi:putative epoxide hydrolase [Gordonia araii NBRC 100433]|uniref:Putative epoxide hydrolase n=1 Tax=Gordonia araii NBRC 100433 TaxID=1073574 RepID=G7H5X3_9ACTN|nr:alpha/beta fold hydrolase [Gordonia araii]GAB11248.1 putative epoxide hydrolase [Gordonia araii NBRC 100433]
MKRITSFENEGLTFDVTDSGRGEAIVLLHGFPQRASSWDKVAPLLQDRGYRTVAPDQRGYSPGARPKGRKAYSLPHLASDAAALIDQVGGPVHLVGHDWGAAVAWAVAANYPDKVKSLTAVSVGHPLAFVKSMGKSNQILRSWYMLAFQIPRAPEAILATTNALAVKSMTRMGMTPEMIERFRREIVDTGALRGGLGWYRALPLAPPNYVGRVSAPTTMVWSDDDAALDITQAVDSERYVDGPFEFIQLNGVSHWIPEERPEELAAAIVARATSASIA